jgi:hypothetical protein
MKKSIRLLILGISAAFFASISGCAMDTAPAPADTSVEGAEAPLTTVGASEHTRTVLGINSFDVYQFEKGRLEVRAVGADKSVLGVFEVTRLDAARKLAPELTDTKFIQYDVTAPAAGRRVVDPAQGSAIEDTLATDSASAKLLDAFAEDIASVGPDAQYQSKAPSLDPQYLVCYTKTKCYGVVLWCQDLCCNAVDWKNQPIDCTTVGQYPCGACFGFWW